MEISLQASNAKLRRYSFVTAKTEQAESRLFPLLEIFIHFEKLFCRFMEIPRKPSSLLSLPPHFSIAY